MAQKMLRGASGFLDFDPEARWLALRSSSLLCILASATTYAFATLSGPTNIVIPEDGVEHDFVFTFTNDVADEIFFMTSHAEVNDITVLESGDLTDVSGDFH